jgi:hypothetical protein
MQTFLPYSAFAATASALDARRLGKQRVEVLQILRALTFDDYGWRTHPAVTMWNGHTAALVSYGVVIAQRWIAGGFSDTVAPQLAEFVAPEPVRSQAELAAAGALPSWLGWEPLHRSHRAALIRKDPEHYGPLFPGVDPELPYVWPESAPLRPARGPVSAWVVRGTPADVATMRRRAFVGLRPAGDEDAAAPAGHGTRNTKRRRQMHAFVSGIRAGETVVVPTGDRLLVGEVVGDYRWRLKAPDGLHHSRPVRWLGDMARADLARPVHLQDPRMVFALRDEPDVATVASTSTAPPGRDIDHRAHGQVHRAMQG